MFWFSQRSQERKLRPEANKSRDGLASDVPQVPIPRGVGGYGGTREPALSSRSAAQLPALAGGRLQLQDVPCG